MDLGTQQRINDLVESRGTDGLIVLIGAPDPESAELAALTVTDGDPTFAGPLAGVQLGLPVYHVLEEEVASALDHDAYQQHIELMRLALDAEGLTETMRRVRAQ